MGHWTREGLRIREVRSTHAVLPIRVAWRTREARLTRAGRSIPAVRSTRGGHSIRAARAKAVLATEVA